MKKVNKHEIHEAKVWLQADLLDLLMTDWPTVGIEMETALLKARAYAIAIDALEDNTL